MAYHTQDTIAAVASAPGGAARGIVRISGDKSLAIVRANFHCDQAWPPDTTSFPMAVAGRFRTSTFRQELPGRLYIWPTRRSFTRQPLAEIHTLGSPALMEAILQTLLEQGVRLAEPGEFTLRAFLAGRIDLTQAEAVLGVIDANGRRQLDNALDQLSGGLSGPLQATRNDLINLLAHLEAGLDFVDEDIEFISQPQLLSQLQSAAQQVHHLLSKMAHRHVAGDKFRVALIGLPNAGKSSLLNALAGEQIAIVTAEEGTTRDFVSKVVDCDGVLCQLIDTAGSQDAPVTATISTHSQQMAGQQAEQAQLRLLCVSTAGGHNAAQEYRLQELAKSADIIVRTKCDLRKIDRTSKSHVNDCGLSHTGQQDQQGNLAETPTMASQISLSTILSKLPTVETSAKIGVGLGDLKSCIAKYLSEQDSDTTGIVGPTVARCRESLRQTASGLQHAIAAAQAGLGEELVAAEIRTALDQLGRVVGTIYTDDILDRVFSRFCIGK